jgi:serine/threonine protein kinase
MSRNPQIPAANGAIPEVPSEVWNRLERILDRFENAWNRGDRPALADYLASAATERRLLLIELAHEDLEYRIRTGERARVEMYLERYPELRQDPAVVLDLIAAEHDCRREREAGDLRSEFRQRFPEFSEELDSRLTAPSEEAPRRPQSIPASHTLAPRATLPEEPALGFPCIPDYEILGVLGRGGMGVVYKARQAGLKRLVALKMVGAGILAEPQELARFRAEAEAAAALQHPNIVPIYEVAEHQGQPYFSMEFIDGGSLAQVVGSGQWAVDNKDTPRRVAELIETLARATHYAHQHGIVHRDLKPSNILLQKNPTTDCTDNTDKKFGDYPCHPCDPWFPKIADFGLAKRLDSGTAGTQTGVILGTPNYMAPEQAAGQAKAIGPATDVYALGAILYEMFTGRPPFQGETPLETVQQVREQDVVPPRRLRPAVPRDLDTICLKCLRKEPGRRYASAQALAEDLRRFQNGEPILARPVGLWERGVKWARRRPLAATLALASLLAVAGLVIGTIQIEEARRQADREAAQARLQEQKARDNYERAEYSYRLARTSMESVLTEIRNDPRFQEGPLESVRKLLLQAELKFYEQFAAQRGDEPAFKAERGEAYLKLGRVTRELEGEAKALAPLRSAVELFAELTRDHPESPEYQAKLAESHYYLGMMHTDSGRSEQLGEAEQALRDALAVMKPLTERYPADSRYQNQTGAILFILGTVYDRTRRTPEAEQTWSEVLTMQKALTATHPADAEYSHNLAKCYTNLAKIYTASRRWPEALRARQQALEISKTLVNQHPQDPRLRFFLGIHYNNLGTLYRDRRRLSEAKQAFQDALATMKSLADQHPAVPKYAEKLALFRVIRGNFVRDTEKPENALPWYTEAITNLEPVTGKVPKDMATRSVLADAYLQRARVLQGLERHREAVPDWDQAIELDTGRLSLRLRLSRAGSLACLGEHVRATAEADAVIQGDQVPPTIIYGAGQTYCLAAAAVPNDSPLKERYAARAAALIRQAAAKGFADVDRLKIDPFLSIVRERQDFQQLLHELEERQKPSKDLPAKDGR